MISFRNICVVVHVRKESKELKIVTLELKQEVGCD